MSVNFLHILEVMGVETRKTRYNNCKSSHFLYVDQLKLKFVFMKKIIYTPLLAFIFSIGIMDAAITVRLEPQSCANWSIVRLWAWTSAGDLFDSWPGVVVNKDADGWYAYTFNESISSVNIIWNDGINQTVDITNVTSSTCYSLNGTSGTNISVNTTECPGAPEPESDPISGKCGPNLTWELSNGILTISGTGPMNDFSSSGSPWFSNRFSIREVRLVGYVTTIGSMAFHTCSNLTSITIPNSVTEIEDHAFFACTSLASIHIPSSVSEIGDYAFENCISLPVFDNIRYADTYLVKVEDKTQSSYNIKDGTKWIGSNAFSECTKLAYITIPSSVISIGDFAFSSCTKLSIIEIPDNVTKVGGGSFRGCTALPVINNIRYADSYLVEVVDKTLSSYAIREGTRFIADDAFAECTNLTSIMLPNTVVFVGESAFRDCNKLSSPVYSPHVFAYLPPSYNGAYSVPTGIKIIAGRAFWDCTQLTSVYIPNSVRNIGNFAFLNCANMANINIPNSVINIGTAAFYDCSKLISIAIPNSVRSMGWRTFRNCASLTSVTIGDGVTSIGDETFYNCTNLNSLSMTNNIAYVGQEAFQSCHNLPSVTIPEKVSFIAMFAFVNCTGITSVTIPSETSTIGDAAFANCTNLASVYNYSTIPQEIVDDVFYNVNKSACVLYVPEESIILYEAADVWKDFYMIQAINGQAIETIETNNVNSTKILCNGQIFILRGERVYTLQGQEVR